MAQNLIQVVMFKVGEETFGLNIEEVREIIRPLKTTTIPDTYDWVSGVVELRGKVIPILNLRKFFGMSDEDTNEKRTVVVETNETWVGLDVDAVEGIAKIEGAEIDQSPGVVVKDYINGIAKNDDSLVILLNAENLLSQTQVESLEELAATVKS